MKQGPFDLWKPPRAFQRVQPSRCRHAVASISGSHQCTKRAEIFFDLPGSKEKVGCCIQHSPFFEDPKKAANPKKRRKKKYERELADLERNVMEKALAWGRNNYRGDISLRQAVRALLAKQDKKA